jgi:hypothetical protein
LNAIIPVLDHALETLAGPFDHGSSSPEAGAGGPVPVAATAMPPSQPLPAPTDPVPGDPRVVAEPDEHE